MKWTLETVQTHDNKATYTWQVTDQWRQAKGSFLNFLETSEVENISKSGGYSKETQKGSFIAMSAYIKKVNDFSKNPDKAIYWSRKTKTSKTQMS